MNEERSIFKFGAEMGIPVGIYTTLISLATIFSDKFSMLSVVALALLVIGPYFIYRLQRRYVVATECKTEFAHIWMFGIVAIVCGSIITMFTTYMTLEFLRPNYIYDQTQLLIEMYKGVPELKNSEAVTILQQALDKGLLPKPLELTLNMFWMVTFTGSVMSAVTAAFASRKSHNINRN